MKINREIHLVESEIFHHEKAGEIETGRKKIKLSIFNINKNMI